MQYYTVGECPVCLGAGELMALKDSKDQKLFFYCYGCDCAWDYVPSEIDSINPIAKFAPNGPALASRPDLEAAGIARFEMRRSNWDYGNDPVMSHLKTQPLK